MHDFGKFINEEEKTTDGVFIYIPYDAAGREFYAAVEQHPHPFYIAIDNDNIIVQAGPEPAAVRIPDHRIIGIDAVPAFTFGHPGDEIYGMKWDDQHNTIVKTRRPLISLSAVRLRLWFLDKGLLPQVDKWIDSLPARERERVWLWWEYSDEFSRDYDYMPVLVEGLNLDPDSFDEEWQDPTGS